MAEHGALGATGRAAGVEQGGQVVRLDGHVLVVVGGIVGPLGQAASAVSVEGQPGRAAGSVRWGRSARIDHHDGRLGLVDDASHLVVGQGGVEGDQGGPAAQAGLVQDQHLGRGGDDGRHPVTAAHPEVVQDPGDASAAPPGLAVGQRPPIGHLGQHRVRVPGPPLGEQAEQGPGPVGPLTHQGWSRKSSTWGRAVGSCTKNGWPPS